MNEIQDNSIGEIMLPDPIAFSFEAPGWTLLFIILMLLLFTYLIYRFYLYRKNKYRREAVAIIQSLQEDKYRTEEILFQVAELLKRVSIKSYGRNDLANLNGDSWIQFVNQKNEKLAFSENTQVILSKTIYQGNTESLEKEKVEEFKNESINWIRKHHV